MKNGMSNNWKYVMDFAQLEPRYERVRNYITFVNEQKYNEEAKEYSKKNETAIQGLSAGILKNLGSNMTGQQRFETMKRFKDEIKEDEKNKVPEVFTKKQQQLLSLADQVQDVHQNLQKG